jgi:hypothetical protein
VTNLIGFQQVHKTEKNDVEHLGGDGGRRGKKKMMVVVV